MSRYDGTQGPAGSRRDSEGGRRRGKTDKEQAERLASFRRALTTLARYLPEHLQHDPEQLQQALYTHLARLRPIGVGDVQEAYVQLCEANWTWPQMAGEFAKDEVQRALHVVADLWDSCFMALGTEGATTAPSPSTS